MAGQVAVPVAGCRRASATRPARSAQAAALRRARPVAGPWGSRGGGRPSNQLRAGWSHRITADTATRDDTKPPVASPVTSRGTARTASASLACLEPLSTQKPRIPAAAAQAPAIRVSSWIRSRTWSRLSPRSSPGGLDRKSRTDSCDSMLRSPAIRSNALSTTTAEPIMIIHPANVTCRGRARVEAMGPFHQSGGYPLLARSGQVVRTRPPSATATTTRPPSRTSPPISIRANGSPIADWISRRNGRAPYAGS